MSQIYISHAGISLEMTYRPAAESLVRDILQDCKCARSYGHNPETREVRIMLNKTDRESCNVVASLAQYATTINLHTYND